MKMFLQPLEATSTDLGCREETGDSSSQTAYSQGRLLQFLHVLRFSVTRQACGGLLSVLQKLILIACVHQRGR